MGFEGLQRVGEFFIAHSLADASRKRYGEHWDAWAGWNEAWGLDPYMRGVSPVEQENQFLYFLCQERYYKHVVTGTLRGRRSGIKKVFDWMQLPFMPGQGQLIKGFMEGASRFEDGTASARKLPVTTAMVRSIFVRTDERKPTGTAVRAAASLGFFFMLRAKNYLAPDGEPYDPEFMLLREDVRFYLNEKYSSQVALTEKTAPLVWGVELTIKKTKTNQRGQKHTQTLKITGDPLLCPVKALVQHLLITQHYPLDMPVTAYGCQRDGQGRAKQVPSRKHMSNVAKAAAAGVGENPAAYASHSFRIGGATALTAVGASEQYVMNLGGWSSATYLIYCRMVTNTVNYQARMVKQSITVLRPA